MLEERGDIHLNFAPDYYGWDVCGPTALLMSRLGYVADSRGKPIVLSAERDQYHLWNGLVVSRNIKAYKEIS
jgi:hypothetical protein